MAETDDRSVRVRIAPSPTGPLHFGTARTALFNWLYARKNKGKFVMRIEDTDRERSEKKYEEELLEGFKWLGLDWDEGPYRQSERTELYKKYLQKLLDDGHAYYCYCTKEDLEGQRQAMLAQGLPPKYNGHCRNLKEPPKGRKPEVIRFKVPEIKVEFKDLVRGKVTFDAALLGDQVIAKDLDTPLYNFAVVVDDELMNISHVIRGEDHLSNTPKQILMQRALNFKEPIYGHIPLILNADRSKMSKRVADTALLEYRSKGYLPSAILNFMALLGWHPKGDREVMSAQELTEEFDISRVQPAGAIFNEEKLAWLNREHMKLLKDDEIVELLKPFFEEAHVDLSEDFIKKLVAIERSRASTLRDFITGGRFLFKLPEYDAKLLIWKNVLFKEVASVLKEVKQALQGLNQEDFRRERLSEVLAGVISQAGNRGTVLWPLRVALSGQAASPDPIDIMEVLGKKEALERVTIAIKKLEA